MAWEEIRLGDVVTLKQGFALNSKSNHYLAKDNIGLPLLKISDLLNNTETLFVKKEIPKQFLVSKSEIIYSRTGQVGYAFMGREGVIYNNCFKVIPYEKKINKIFLYKLLNTNLIRTYAQTLATGTAQLDLNHDAFKSIKIKIPTLEIQQKIVNIISNYDNLIENNNKRINLLENMAEEIYKEWFVRLRFPNYQNTKIEDGIPDGWEELILEELTSVLGDGLHGTPEYDEFGEYYFINGNNLVNRKIDLNSNAKRTNTSEYLKYRKNLNQNTILVSINGTLGNLAFYDNEKVFLGKSVCYFNVKKDVSKYLIMSILNSFDFQKYIEINATGATIKNVSLKSMREYKILFPSKDIQNNFDKLVKPFFSEIKILQKKNQNLKQTRDLLLPRLISGKLDLEDLEIV